MATLTTEEKTRITDAVETGSRAEVAKAVKEVGGIGEGPVGAEARNNVWYIFMITICLALLVLVGALVLKQKPDEAVTTLATALITGLFALFAPSPAGGAK